MDKRKTFCLLAPYLADSHFKKDVCMIPYILQKHYGYKALLVTNYVDNTAPEFPSKKLYTEDIQFEYLTPSYLCTKDNADSIYDGNNDNNMSCAKDLEAYILENAKKIDILFLFGFYNLYFKAVETYKKENENGLVYLKLDANRHWINNTATDNHFHHFLKNCDLITCETLVEYINLKWPVPVHYIPNGYYRFDTGADCPVSRFSDKENIIFTAGRLGTYPKATEILMEAFRIAAEEIPSWKLVLAGTVEPDFKPYIKKFLDENPHLADRIQFTGFLNDPNKLNIWYRKAKIFAFPSRSEGFASVVLEAKAHGCYIIASDIDSNRDAVSPPELRGKTACRMDADKNNIPVHNKVLKYGSLFKVNDFHEMALRFVETCSNEKLLEQVCHTTQEDVAHHYSWIDLCGRIDNMIQFLQYKT